MLTPPLTLVYHFGPFELNSASGDLTRNGLRLRLQDKPRSILIALVTRSGETIARSELQSLLWPADNFVDFEDGLNTAMRKLRETLGDDPQHPRYIETVRGHGYRFIAPVRRDQPPATTEALSVPSMAIAVDTPSSPAPLHPPLKLPSRKSLYTVLAGTAACAIAAAAWWLLPAPPPRLVRVTQITTQSKIDFLVKPVTEGARILYLERSGGHWNAMETSLHGGVPQPIPGLPPNTRVMDLSPDRSTYLLGTFVSRGSPSSLWLMPVQGGAPVRLNDIESGEAVWHPDGLHIVYAKENELWKVATDGTDSKRLVSLPGSPNWLAWSPDGKHLRFTAGDANGRVSVWEMDQDGSHLHRPALPSGPDAQQCCGEWSGDGRYFIFTSLHGGHSSLWAIREPAMHLRRTSRVPLEVVDWPTGTGAFGAHVMPDGHSFLFYAGSNRSQIARLDLKSGSLTQISAEGFSQPQYTADGNWLIDVDVNNGAVWKASKDGSQRIRLSLEGFSASFPRWSPDGQSVAVAASEHGAPSTTYLVPSSGGAPRLLLPNQPHIVDPDWSPDGKSLVVVHALPRQNNEAIFLVNLQSRTETMVPQSEGLFFPHWSPDGRYLAAYGDGAHTVQIYDFQTRKWQVAIRGTAIGFPVWSHDARYLLYQQVLEEGEPIYRYDLHAHTADRIADFQAALSTGISRCALIGLTPDDAPLVDVTRGNSDLYRAELDLPQ